MKLDLGFGLVGMWVGPLEGDFVGFAWAGGHLGLDFVKFGTD